MTDPEVALARVRAERSRAPDARYEQHAHVVADIEDDAPVPRKSRAVRRPTREDAVPEAGSSARELRAAIVTMAILGPPRGLDP